MAYKLIVENYGKIEKAEVEVSPLTLFVGDNNSGKSYLLSLIWTLFSGTGSGIICKGLKEVMEGEFSQIYDDIKGFFTDQESWNEENFILMNEQDIFAIINTLFRKNKDDLVRSIFNYDGMSIGKLEITTKSNRQYKIAKEKSYKEGILIEVYRNDDPQMSFQFQKNTYKDEKDTIFFVIETIIDRIIRNDAPSYSAYYLPAARTGFMLAKNTINQVGRRRAFDNVVRLDEEEKSIEVSPFPKPIIHFLDAMDNLNSEVDEKRNKQLIAWINSNMVNGNVVCIDNNSGNIQYIPEGMQQGIPLRVTSGVVTELSPLILLLKYSRILQGICYEEPEMCLHPQLQYQMAKLLIRMVNSGIGIAASTHSDIIIQHVNNMCQLSSRRKDEETLKKIGLEKDDLIDISKVAIYQFSEKNGQTKVERILPQDDIFQVESFSDALKKILNQTLEISDIVYGEEE